MLEIIKISSLTILMINDYRKPFNNTTGIITTEVVISLFFSHLREWTGICIKTQ